MRVPSTAGPAGPGRALMAGHDVLERGGERESEREGGREGEREGERERESERMRENESCVIPWLGLAPGRIARRRQTVRGVHT